MSLRRGLVLLSLLALPARAELVDLTHTFDHTTIYWPTATPFSLVVRHRGPTPGGYWYESNDFTACEHGGTHLDAPCHFAKGRWTVEAIPLEVLTGEAVVVEIAAHARGDREATLRIADLEAWERRHGSIPERAVVLLRTGFGRFWPDRKAYLGTDVKGDVKNLRFPSFGAPAAEWLVRRGVKLVGLDTASVDVGSSSTYPCHVTFGTANVPALENLANLDRLPPRGARITALPMKIGGGSGAPCRVVAELPK